jgi:hypothetical protein
MWHKMTLSLTLVLDHFKLQIVSVLHDTENCFSYCIHACHKIHIIRNLPEDLLPRKFLQLMILEITAILLYDLKVSRRLNVTYSSRAVSHISWLQTKNVSGIISVPTIRP